uniref:Secreted protein n=1 Tax=Cacopsylla melanoneura TaxID=428564 RepID=A0A8D8Z7W7_9HEMI
MRFMRPQSMIFILLQTLKFMRLHCMKLIRLYLMNSVCLQSSSRFMRHFQRNVRFFIRFPIVRMSFICVQMGMRFMRLIKSPMRFMHKMGSLCMQRRRINSEYIMSLQRVRSTRFIRFPSMRFIWSPSMRFIRMRFV